MFGIIGAMPEEIEAILNDMDQSEVIHFGIRKFYQGTYNNQEIVVVLAGIGKVNASITTTLLIENFDVDYIVNIGVAGGQNGVTHKDVVIGNEILYHDVDVTKFSDYVRGQLPGSEATFKADLSLIKLTTKALENQELTYKIGKIASGDQFVTELSSIKEVNELYSDILAIEMEAAAIAHTATLYKIPFIIYRSISDVIGDENQDQDFKQFVKEAADNASKVLGELLLKI